MELPLKIERDQIMIDPENAILNVANEPKQHKNYHIDVPIEAKIKENRRVIERREVYLQLISCRGGI